MTLTERIERFIALPTIALVGMSRKGRKFGNIACRELRAKGYRVYPVHPIATEIDGVRCYPSFAKLPERVDGALIVVPPHVAIDVVRDAAEAGITRVWLQQGAESAEVVAVCDQLKLITVAGECILMFADPRGIHRAHRWIHRLTRRSTAA
ncbi:MAG TPA: CoA-binding protein [Vicinamibacterales bacterium]|nr:CoA-binding protein [Vicinamibacterales bacterium]